MSAKTYHGWYVFTPHGAFRAEGDTAKIALKNFQRSYPDWEALGIFREDLIVKPPKGPEAPPFLCMFVQGELKQQPPAEGGR